MAIPMTQQAFPRPNPQSHHRGSIRSHQSQDRLQAQPTPPPDCIYDNAPARGPRRTHPAPGQAAANQVAVPVDTDNPYSNGKEKEEESDIMYAALNHQVKPRAAARPAQPRVEGSEYAAIRVSWALEPGSKTPLPRGPQSDWSLFLPDYEKGVAASQNGDRSMGEWVCQKGSSGCVERNGCVKSSAIG